MTFTIDAATYGLRFQLPVGLDDVRDGDNRIWQRIINRPLRGLATAIEACEDELRRLESDLAQADTDAGTVFPQQAQLDEFRVRLAEIEDRLMPATQAEPSADVPVALVPPER